MTALKQLLSYMYYMYLTLSDGLNSATCRASDPHPL